MELSELKAEYEKLSRKHKLPSFKELNEIFEIERIEKESDLLLRQVRKVMMDKIVGYIRFSEMLLNPSQAPLSYMSMAIDMSNEIKESVRKIYKTFIELELKALEKEVDYSEDEESAIIIDIYQTWNKLKGEMKKVMSALEASWNADKPLRKEKDYFG